MRVATLREFLATARVPHTSVATNSLMSSLRRRPAFRAGGYPCRQATGPLAAEFADTQGSGAIDLFLLFGFLVGLWAVPRFGRIHMQVIGFVGMTLAMLILVAPELAAGGAAAHVWTLACTGISRITAIPRVVAAFPCFPSRAPL